MSFINCVKSGLIVCLLLVACDGKTSNTTASPGGAGQSGVDAGGSAAQSGGSAAQSGGSASHGGKPSTTPGDVTDGDSFLAAQVHVLCERIFRCLEADDDFLSERYIFGSVEGCETAATSLLQSQPSWRDRLAQEQAGKLHYVPAMGQTCLDALGSCNGPDFDEGPCLEAFDGSAQTGEDCYRTEDCKGDAFCDFSAAGCPAKCAPRKAEGEACSATADCIDAGNVVCRGASSGASPVCVKLERAPVAHQGEPCTLRLDGAAPVLVLCADDLWCAVRPGGDSRVDLLGACVPPIAVDGACGGGDDVCAAGMCDTTLAKCRAVTLQKQVGDSCDRTLGVYCSPVDGLYCDTATAKCVGSGDGKAGSVCFDTDLQRPCDPGFYCRRNATDMGAAGTCQPLLAADEACVTNTNASCESGTCDGGVCLARYCSEY